MSLRPRSSYLSASSPHRKILGFWYIVYCLGQGDQQLGHPARPEQKQSDFWALGALLVRLPVRAVGMPPLAGVAARVGTEILTHSRDTDEFR